MYVYVKDWKIRLKSETRIRVPGATEYKTEHKITDRLIYEGWQIKVYEDSKQYWEDINRYHLQKELKNTKKKNEDLLRIANNKIRKEMELEVKGKEPDEYHRKIYLLKKLKWSQHLWWQENG
jgi:hypothetical protein